MMMRFGLRALLATRLVVAASGRLRRHKEHDTDGAASITPGRLSPPQRQGLSIHNFEEILFSEAESEYGYGELTEEETNLLWDAASDYEWNRAIEIEEKDIAKRRLSSNIFSSPAIFPFLVCDPEINKSGYECRQRVASHFGEDLMSVANSENMTCFIASTWASKAEGAPPPLIVHPFMPEAKLQRGIAEEIMEPVQLSHRLYSVLCPSQSASPEDAERLISKIMGSIGEASSASSSRRFLRLEKCAYDAMTEEVLTKRKNRRSLLSSYQQQVSNETCMALFSELVTTAGAKGDSFTIELPSNNTLSTFPDAASCILHLIEHLSVRPEICAIGTIPDMKTMNEDAQWIVQSGVEEKLPFFEKGITGKGEVVACSDSGLDTDHCYFWDATGDVPFDGTIDLSRRKVVQYVGHADNTDDYFGHGTHVVGTILGRRSEDGETELTGPGDGIARDAKVAFFDIGVTNSWYLDVPPSASELLDPGRNAGARIHSASWGSDDNGYGYEEREFDAYLKENDDFMIVVAAGNAGPRRNTVGKPATCKNAISVGASQNGWSKDNMASFSSRGPTQDGRTKPDIVAPGDEIESAAAGTTSCESNGLFGQSGTSMAAPVVSGTLALIRQYFRDGFYPSGSRNDADSIDPSGQLVKAVLLNGAQPLAGLQSYDINQNFGRVSLIDSLPLEGGNNIKAEVVDRKNIQSGQIDTIAIDIDMSMGCTATEISVTITWADPPAFTNCKQCVLNDLDLYVTKEGDPRTYFANGRNNRDKINNAERVRVPASDGDKLTIHVEATNLQDNSQDYALAVTGCLAGAGEVSPGNPPVTSPTPELGNPPVQSPIPGPPAADEQNSIETLLDANTLYRYFGNFFEVDALVALSVYGMDIHTAFTGNLDISIWTKQGTYVGYESNESAWTKIGSGTIQGQGAGVWTHIPCELFGTRVPIAEFSTQAFYVRLSEDSLLYSPGADRFENGDAVVRTGASIGPSGVHSPRTANVVLRYKKERKQDAPHTPAFGFGR